MSNPFADAWFTNNGWSAYPFQKKCWREIHVGHSGLLNAPTGSGKTFAIWFGILRRYYAQEKRSKKSVHALWITPLRALSKEILLATQNVSAELELDYTIALRTGDTSTAERTRQKKNPPQALITTPESIHLLIASKGYKELFGELEFVIVDEWHELMGSKRGVMIELALQVLRAINPKLIVWGISATIGNLEEATDILLRDIPRVMVRSQAPKKVVMKTIFPDSLERFPWSGHLGIKLLEKVVPLIYEHQSTLLFTNTRSQAEIWYYRLLEANPDFAGQIALHHGSVSDELRIWVEDNLRNGRLKAVVCTSSLDLGVDFPSVDCVVQIGSPKSIARYLQRAGRSGHRPGDTSKIYFLPTHSLEILEGASLRYAVAEHIIEQRIPYIRSFDMLIQFLMTLAVGEGFEADEVFDIVRKTHCYESITRMEFEECIFLLTQGGKSLYAYDQFYKMVFEEGKYRVTSRRLAMQHRLSIGAIVSDMMLRVRMVHGKYLGTVEEYFIARLKEGDTFWFTGRPLQIVHIRSGEIIVKESSKNKGIIPSWQGGRMPISSDYGQSIRHVLTGSDLAGRAMPELRFLQPLFDEQNVRSHVPRENELLVEYIQSKFGFHLFVYPFEGKLVHDGMANILAYRISEKQKISFSIASNDYGFELLSADDFFVDQALVEELFSSEGLMEDIAQGVNVDELARRIFRDIAAISGLVFTGTPWKPVKARHLQANSGLFFDVFKDYEPGNLLYRQAYDEVYDFQLEIQRMQKSFERIGNQQIVFLRLERFSPFSFPIFSEAFRMKYSNEDWEDRLLKLKKELHAI